MSSGRGLDFEGLSKALLNRSRELIPGWLPGGKLIGLEWCCGDITGKPGKSLKVNIQTGKWKDFAAGIAGGDLISLYAAIEHISSGDAYKQLSNKLSYVAHYSNSKAPNMADELCPPPSNAPMPNFNHLKLGAPSGQWSYRSMQGELLYYIIRYDPPGEKKQFIPYSWSGKTNQWIKKAWPNPRPLYGLEFIDSHPNTPILIVEGEKACDSARTVISKYIVITWQGGAQAFKQSDITPLYGRKILIWPDSDKPGVEAGAKLASILSEHCPEVKLLDVGGMDSGFDAYDAFNIEGWTWDTFLTWAKPRAQIIRSTPEPALVPEVVEQLAPMPTDSDQPDITVQVDTGEATHITQSMAAAIDKLGLATQKNGAPIPNSDNVLRALERFDEFKDAIWYDEFHNKIFTRWQTRPRELEDLDLTNISIFMQRNLGMQKTTEYLVKQGVMSYAHANIKNEPKDWLESLVWDGTPRVRQFFIDYFGAHDDEYSKSASQNWWVSMAARIYTPGCKVDNMVILEGGQGKFKSTALGAIGGPWYTEVNESVTSKDFFLAIQGKLLIEIGELDSFSRSEVNTIKKVITSQIDRFRPPYGALPKDFPRRSVFVGTTNEDEYLKDHTGARRFWPVKISTINVDKIKADREQLFAEAVALFKSGANWWDMPKDLTETQQENRRQVDEWESFVADYLIGKHEITVWDVAINCFKMEAHRVDRSTQMRIAKCIAKFGWHKFNTTKNGKQVKVWQRPDGKPVQASQQPKLINYAERIRDLVKAPSEFQ